MIGVFPCVKAMQPCKQLICHTGRHASQQIRQLPSRTGGWSPAVLARAFRLSPSAAAPVRNRFSRLGQIKERNVDSGSTTIDAGRIGAAAAALLGLGGLCYYGLSTTPSATDSRSLSAFDRSAVWPDYVRQRIKSTYAYLAGGAAIAAGTALTLSRSPAFCRVMIGSGWLAPIAMMLGSMGAGVVCQMIPYPTSGGLSGKHLAWVVFSASIGGMLMPVCLIGGPILSRAAVYTGGIVGGLSIAAASAPSERFLSWGGPLAIGLGVVVISSLGSMFLSPVSRVGSGMAAISLYGGLLLFSGFLLYDTQLVVKRAEALPPNNAYQSPMIRGVASFDPINNSIHILMDTVNIFVRMVAIMAGGQRRK